MKSKLYFLSATACILGAGCAGQIQPAREASLQRAVYYGVSVVDPISRSITADAYILVKGERIVGIGQGATPRDWRDARAHDMSGLYAMPGLIDTHAHVTLGPVEVSIDDNRPRLRALDRPDIIAYNARVLLESGVTSVRNPAGPGHASSRYNAAVSADPTYGPEARHAGEIIDRPALPFDGLVITPSADLSIREIVRRQADAGADFIKLYENLSEPDLIEGIAAADEVGLPTIAHLSDISWTRAAHLGVDVLVHLMPTSPDLLPASRREAYIADLRPGGFKFFEWWEAVDLEGPEIAELIAVLVAKKVYVEATLVAFEPVYWGDDEAVLARASADAHPDMLANWRSGFRFDSGWRPDDYQRAKVVWPKVLHFLRMLNEAGVPMTIGTDLSNPFVSPRGSMAREMVLHGDAGIPAWDILRMATADAAALLGMADRTGRLKVGMEADIVFLGADPSASLTALDDIRAVLTDGIEVALPTKPAT